MILFAVCSRAKENDEGGHTMIRASSPEEAAKLYVQMDPGDNRDEVRISVREVKDHIFQVVVKSSKQFVATLEENVFK